jgi:hypothetical protein
MRMTFRRKRQQFLRDIDSVHLSGRSSLQRHVRSKKAGAGAYVEHAFSGLQCQQPQHLLALPHHIGRDIHGEQLLRRLGIEMQRSVTHSLAFEGQGQSLGMAWIPAWLNASHPVCTPEIRAS